MSFRKKHVKNKIHKIRPKKPVFKKLWFWTTVLFLASVFIGFYFFLFFNGFQVKNIKVSGNSKIGTQELQAIAQNFLKIKLVKLWNFELATKSIFLINTNKINNEILGKFPALQEALLSKNFPQTLSLDVVERKPLGIFCSQNDQCFLIDQNGVAFENIIIYALNANYTIVRQAGNDKKITAGEEVVEKNIANIIYKIQKNLKENLNIDLKEAIIAAPIRLNTETRENWKIYFDLDKNADINFQLTKLKLLFDGEISPQTRKNLRYINLIPKDRAIICDNATCAGQ